MHILNDQQQWLVRGQLRHTLCKRMTDLASILWRIENGQRRMALDPGHQFRGNRADFWREPAQGSGHFVGQRFRDEPIQKIAERCKGKRMIRFETPPLKDKGAVLSGNIDDACNQPRLPYPGFTGKDHRAPGSAAGEFPLLLKKRDFSFSSDDDRRNDGYLMSHTAPAHPNVRGSHADRYGHVRTSKNASPPVG